MNMYLGQRAYEVWRDRLRERNIPAGDFKALAYWRQEAWQSVGEEIARECGVDPAAFRNATQEGQ